MPRSWPAAGRDPKSRLSGFVFRPELHPRETRINMLPGRPHDPMIHPLILATRPTASRSSTGPTGDIAQSRTARHRNALHAATSSSTQTLIHPTQIEPATPSPRPKRHARARKIIASFDCLQTSRAGDPSGLARWWRRLHADMARRRSRSRRDRGDGEGLATTPVAPPFSG